MIWLSTKFVCRFVLGGEAAGGYREFVVVGEANSNGKLSVSTATAGRYQVI